MPKWSSRCCFRSASVAVTSCEIRLGGAHQQARSPGKVGHRDELRVRGLNGSGPGKPPPTRATRRQAGRSPGAPGTDVSKVNANPKRRNRAAIAGRRLLGVTQQPAEVALQQQRPRPGEFPAQPAVLLQRAPHRSGNERELVRLQRQGAVGVRFHQCDEVLDRPVADRGQPVDEQSGDDRAADQRQDRVPVEAGEPLRIETAGHQRDVVPVDDVGA